MTYRVNFLVRIVVSLCVIFTTNSVTAQKTDDKYNALLDIANTFFQETFDNNQANGQSGSNEINANGMVGIAQAIGSLIKKDGNGGLDAAQILAGIQFANQLINANNGNANGASETGSFDPATIQNVIDMFTPGNNDGNKPNEIERQKRRTSNSAKDNNIDTGNGIESILNIASAFMSNSNNDKGKNEDLTNLLPMAIQVMNSFGGVNGDKLQSYLKEINVLWDQFANPELTNALWEKSGIKQIFKVSKRIFYHSNMCLSIFNYQTDKKCFHYYFY